ncbi:MAG: sulfatase-like hydrolase/transferase [Caldilineaceae bacterium]
MGQHTQTSTGWSRTGCATPTSIPPRSARPPAPASSAGRNHHSNGVAAIMETATGYPGYDAACPSKTACCRRCRFEHGYNTFCTGKWHLSPAEESTPAGPFHRWPLGRSFERFYGFLGGETNQWFPDLTYDNHSVPQPKTVEEGYHLDEDLIDHTIQFILDAHVNAPDKPFFLYHAPAAHAPIRSARSGSRSTRASSTWAGTNTARSSSLGRRNGHLPGRRRAVPRDPDVPEWDTLTDQQKALYAHFMKSSPDSWNIATTSSAVCWARWDHRRVGEHR